MTALRFSPVTGAARLFGSTPMLGRHPDWHRLYEVVPSERLPWYFAELDPDLTRELDRRGLFAGSFLDVGTGSGHQAVALARRGFTVTATDVAAAAIATSRRLPAGGLVRFLVDDILESRLTGQFDYAFDRGCLHVLAPLQWPKMAATLARRVRPGGLLFVKCVSAAEGPADFGPERFCEVQLERVFSKCFELESVTPTVFQGPLPHQPRALFAVLRRRET